MFNEEILNVSMVEQGTDEWHYEKMGIQSASKGELYLVNGKSGDGIGSGLISYAEELAHKMAVIDPEFDSFSSKSAQWGIDTEPYARKVFSQKNMCQVEEYGFISSKDYRYGFSPDGAIQGTKIGTEIKCYDTKNHIPIILSKEVPKKVIAQCQFSMMVSEFEAWYAVFYDPRLVKHLQYAQFLIKRDEKMIDMMRAKGIICSNMIDDELELMGI